MTTLAIHTPHAPIRFPLSAVRLSRIAEVTAKALLSPFFVAGTLLTLGMAFVDRDRDGNGIWEPSTSTDPLWP